MANDDDPLTYEEVHVHSVYESIASHFSSTRYKPWPVVDAFLRGLHPGSIGLDVGCGNGKYLNVNKEVFIVGSDRSSNLISLARDNQLTIDRASPHDVIVADTLSLPHAERQFDFAICIAVIHHLSSTERRVAALKAILKILRYQKPPREDDCDPPRNESDGVNNRPTDTNCTVERLPAAPMPGKGPGQALIFAWALEQSSSRRGWKEGGEQDVLVPWIMKGPGHTNRAPGSQRTGESLGDADARNPTAALRITSKDKLGEQSQDKVFNRFYHLYRQGELESECRAAGGKVIASGYDRDNWWLIIEP